MEKMKNKKIWIAAALICILLGAALLTIGRTIGGIPGFYIDGTGLHTAEETLHSEVIRGSDTLEPFKSIELDIEYADVELVDSDRFAVEYCTMAEYGEPVCEVKNGKLIFCESHSVRLFNVDLFYSSFGVSTEEARYYVRIEIPKDTDLKNVSLDIESGNLDITSLQADALNISNEYGDTSLNQYKGGSLNIQMESGNLSLGALDTADAKIYNEYGKVNISDAKGSRLTIQAESSDCQIDRLQFSDTEIENEYGNISLGLPGDLDSYGFDLRAEYGDIRVGSTEHGYGDGFGEMTYRTAGDGKKRISVDCESGNIDIYPTE